ncbi:pitrilysin [Photorhabdus heterorhabditis]|uniref:Protease 3 n=1 Tax=Photorhabdus heterorhabditis TaxID=880156 RepID=A0A5B0X7K8_9GAMM|nr:pitrilysin [Photorhabdus heterorhabditis]KAA1195263.1 pitrilysin [Photorhabdus heterorhabditis]KOY61503.1 protease [Photorhabdus heterorhabditis]
MHKHFIRMIVVMFLLVWGTASYAKTQQWQPLQETIYKSENDHRQYQGIKLANNMTVLLVSDEKATKSLAAVAIPVGSMENPDSQLGLAHYLEHMVLMGSKRYPQSGSLSEFLQKHGGSYNASTASYRTAFYLEVENKALANATDRLADALAEPLLDPVNADRERNAVNAELTMARSRDGMRVAQIRSETLNPAHPNARFSGGNLETLKDKPGSKLQTELVDFYQRYYSANLMKGVIYGNQSIDKLTQIAVDTFGRIPDRKASVPAITVPAVTEKEKGIVIHYVPAQPQKALQLEFSIDNNSADFRSKTDEYLGYMIGNRSLNTLSDWLQTQGLAESISAGAEPMVDRNKGIFFIYVTLTDKGLEQRDQVVAAIFTYIHLLKQKGIQKSYFDEIAKVLNLSFQYGSIVRNMNYIEWLSDAMLRVPVSNVLNAGYLADDYNPKAIVNRLDELTPENARIWYISPKEPHNKQAYFVQAPYQVDRITSQQMVKWQQLEKQMNFSLPVPNPYIPDDLQLIKAGKNQKHPEMILEQQNFRLLYMPSQYFADEPKASIALDLRNAESLNSARKQVTFSLLDYLALLSLDQLGYQASVAGMSISTGSADGLQLGVSGYTQRLPELLTSLINDYMAFAPTENQLEQAKSWYREQIEVSNNGKAYDMAMQPLKRLSVVPYTEQSVRLKELEAITVQDIVEYRHELIKNSALQMMIIGNLTEQQSKVIAESAHKQLANQGNSWWSGDKVVIDKNYQVNFQRVGSSTDSALAEIYIPNGYNRIEGYAYSSLLSNMLKPWFYEQLRTVEQLGYAVFAFNTRVGEQWGLGFLLQSNSKQPKYLNQRYQDFYQKASSKLEDMSQTDFEQYKNALINESQQPPQTFYAEVARFSGDFSRNNFSFDSRDKMLEVLKKTTQKQLINFYRDAVNKHRGLSFISQVIGKSGNSDGYAKLKGWKTYHDVTEFQQQLPVEVKAR